VWLSGPTLIGNTVIGFNTNGPMADTASPPKIAAILESTAATGEAFVQAPSTAGASWTVTSLPVGSAFASSFCNWYDAPNNRCVMALLDPLASQISSVGLVNLDTGAFTSIAGPTTLVYKNAVVAVLPNGNIVLALNTATASTGITFWTWNGSSWSGPVNLTDTGSTSHIPTPIDIAVDSNNVTYIVYQINIGSVNEDIRVQSVDASGHLGPVCTVVNGASTDTQAVGRTKMLLFNGQLWVAVLLPSTSTAYVFRSGPTSALVFPNSTPVTFIQSTSATAVSGDTYAGVGLMGSSTLYFVFSAQTGTIGTNLTSDRIMVNTYSGTGDTWNGLVQAFDWVQHPPTAAGFIGYPTQHAHYFSNQQNADGTFGAVCDFLNSSLNCFCFYTQWTLASGGPPSPPIIIINPPPGLPPGTPGNPPPPGTIGIPYVLPLLPLGGTPPYVCTVISGPLPPGLMLVDCTSISGTPTTPSGTPTQPGPYCFTIQLTDSTNHSAQASACIPINSPPAVTCGSPGPPNGTVGIPYSFTFAATGGIPPFVWSIISGSFPPGLVLNAQTGAVSGTPTTAGTYTFTIAATSTASGTGQASCGTGIATCIIIVQPHS